MSWDHLRTCLLDEQEIPVEAITNDRERDIVVHRYPGIDGGRLEDLGREPIQTTLDAVFYGQDYRTQFQNVEVLQAFAEPVTFQHPHYGSLRVRVKKVQDRTDVEGAQFIKATILLIEDAVGSLGFEVSEGGVSGATQTFDETLAAVRASLAVL